MSFEEVTERVLLPAFSLGTRTIEFSGGEFLTRKDALKILVKADEIGFRIAIASNGILLNEKMIDRLQSALGKNLFISLGINSFDSSNVQTRDLDYERVMQVIGLLEKKYVGVNLCVTFGRFNAETVGSTLKNIRDLKLPFNRIPYVPRNCDNFSGMMDKELMKNYFSPAISSDYHGYVSYTPFFLSPEYYKEISGQNEENNKIPTNPSIGCWCGSFYSINPEGEVSPCALLSDHCSGGNVLTCDLENILKESELFRRIIDRKTFKGKCGVCRFRFTCGGCRALAYYQNGDVYGEDPTCFISDMEDSELKDISELTAKNFKNFLRMAQMGKSYFPPDNV